jgi:hypothetical protein
MLGCAILAAVAAGAFSDVPTAAAAMVAVDRVVQPDPAAVQAYRSGTGAARSAEAVQHDARARVRVLQDRPVVRRNPSAWFPGAAAPEPKAKRGAGRAAGRACAGKHLVWYLAAAFLQLGVER